jgi:ABC-type lipoprotein release transport system permease subunit
MNLIVKIAWRNLLRHRGKSLIIGSILFIGALLMTVGNGVISGMNKGLQKNIVDGFTGDLVLVSDRQESDNVFLEMMGKAVEPITNFKQIDSALKNIPYVKKWLPVGKNFAMALNEDGGLADGVYVLGVDMKAYREFFGDNIKVVEGRLLGDRERGVLVPTGWRKQFAEFYGILFAVDSTATDTAGLGKDVTSHMNVMTKRTSVVYMGMSADNATTDIRAPVRGIIKYRSLNMIFGNFPIVDIESYRECQGYFSAAAKTADVRPEMKKLLSEKDDDLDNMFAQDNMIVANSGARTNAALAEGSLRVEEKKRDTAAVDLTAGTFNLVLVKLAKRSNLDKTVKDLNAIFKQKGLGLKAIPWKKAIGPIGSMAVLIKTVLFFSVLALFFVAVIIIVNTLSMAAIERTTEIGMMRAVGAQKSFIRAMFLGETGALAAIFGGAGIVVGIAIVEIITLCKFTTDIDMLQLLYGGELFRPLLSFADIVLAVFQLIIVTLVAVVYPIRVAGNITPLDAVSRE